MRLKIFLTSGALGTALAAGMAASLALAAPAPASAAALSPQPTETVTLSVGRGQMVRLSAPMSDLFVADDKVADVQVRSPTQLYVFGKAAGETTVYATSKSGQTVFSATVRVGANITNVGAMLKLAMPDAAITATPMNGLMLLTGTVAAPTDIEEAQNLVQAFVGKDVTVISRVKTATPMQVNLQVKIAEVNRNFAKQIGVNLMTSDKTNGFQFNVSQGRDFTKLGLGAGTTTLGMAGKLFGVDVASALDLAENDGLVTTLAEPNLTALSGETASFLAGGEIPIPISQALGTISVEYKQYGISLSFTPTVLSDGRISMRVRPEVSQLSDAGSVTLNNFTIPGITTRRAETTVELGSGQSFMIGGLLNNSHNNTINKAPFLGDLPILGTLFRSNKFQRSESELVIVVTPYLVKPVSAGAIALPTDGYKGPTDFERVVGGQTFSGESGQQRPKPTTAPSAPAQPALPAGAGIAPPPASDAHASNAPKNPAPAPGFSFN